MARLDRLGQVKEIAQISAAIGREFSYRLLEVVSPIEGPALQDALAQLAVAELIHAGGAYARGDLRLQTRTRAGNGLRFAAAQPPPAHSRGHRSRFGGAFC